MPRAGRQQPGRAWGPRLPAGVGAPGGMGSSLHLMCGIIGVTGRTRASGPARRASPPRVPGLRLGRSGSDRPGRALAGSGGRGDALGQDLAALATSAARRPRPGSGTPGGPPMAGRPRERPSPSRLHRPARPRAQRDHREPHRAGRRAGGPAATPWRRRPTPRCSPTWSRRGLAPGAPWPRQCVARSVGSGAPSPSPSSMLTSQRSSWPPGGLAPGGRAGRRDGACWLRTSPLCSGGPAGCSPSTTTS